MLVLVSSFVDFDFNLGVGLALLLNLMLIRMSVLRFGLNFDLLLN